MHVFKVFKSLSLSFFFADPSLKGMAGLTGVICVMTHSNCDSSKALEKGVESQIFSVWFDFSHDKAFYNNKNLNAEAEFFF